jgi:hypothetical protein
VPPDQPDPDAGPEAVVDDDGSNADEWLILIYKVPTEPSRLRVSVWRRLKGLGAIYLQSSAAALPAGASAERALRKLRHEIIQMAGSAVLLRSTLLGGGSDVAAKFRAARDDEYDEIIDKCEDFLAGIDKEFDAEHFSFAELEENEVDHTKLVNWLAKVRHRDVLGSAKRGTAEDAVVRCAAALERYAQRVYAEDPDLGRQGPGPDSGSTASDAPPAGRALRSGPSRR